MSQDDGYSLARTLLLIKVFSDEMARRRKTDLVTEAAKLMPEGTRLPVLIGSEHVGWVSMPKASTKATVTDERALRQFVGDRFPTEIETVERIRPAFLEALKGAAKEYGGVLVDGEVVVVPGLTVETENPVPRATTNDGAFRTVVDALRDGTLGEVRDLLAIEPGGES